MITNKNKVANGYKGLMSFVTRFTALVALMFAFTTGVQAQSQITMDMVWVGSTANTADFQVVLTNTGTTALKFNGIIIRGPHALASSITTGGTISWNALNDNTNPAWNNGTGAWPNLTSDSGVE